MIAELVKELDEKRDYIKEQKRMLLQKDEEIRESARTIEQVREEFDRRVRDLGDINSDDVISDESHSSDSTPASGSKASSLDRD